MVLEASQVQSIRELQKDLDAKGKLLSKEKLAACRDTFRNRFGPEKLRNLDGEALLSTIHDHGNRDSLVYWLEFKSDDEFPPYFGSIAGGSALKFGIYKRSDTGVWMTGSPTNQRELAIEEAIAIARKHRDQLVKGTEIVDQFPAEGTDADYSNLQVALDKYSPDVSDMAWGHKYFSVLFPDKLDDFHVSNYQKFHLIRLFQTPPDGEGRYLAAGRFISIARSLGVSVNTLTRILVHRHGEPYWYWRIGTSDGTERRNQWDGMRDGSLIAIGWSELGDLSSVSYNKESKESIRRIMAEKSPSTPSYVGNATQQVFNFVAKIEENDLVLAADGAKILGIGKVTGPYYYDPAQEFPHRRPVKWLFLGEWRLSKDVGLRTSVHKLKDDPQIFIEIERKISAPTPPTPVIPDLTRTTPLEGIPGRIQSNLARKSQVILYGPPGTGKTYWAEIAACELAARSAFGKPYGQLQQDQVQIVKGTGEESPSFVRMCCFHPAYGYEDFLEGYRPESVDGRMNFVLRDGIFKTLCKDANSNPDRNFYLIIDEINRGDIPRIFGELLTILEKDKRGKSILLPLSSEQFQIPKNVFIIGTMNTADRSIALLDTALRRRFGFIELMPDTAILGDAVVNGIPIGRWLEELNRRICAHVGRDARNLQVGHSYLMEGSKPIQDFHRLSRVIREDIIPLLEEYCYEDYSSLEKILGPGLVDSANQKIRHDLFEDGGQENLIRALLQPCPDIATSLQVVAAESKVPEDEGEELEGGTPSAVK
jgi:5-methylcytosine-specific restriction protein B